MGLQECVVKTSKGPVSVLVCGDQGKPALITYPDVALNCMLSVLVPFGFRPMGLFLFLLLLIVLYCFEGGCRMFLALELNIC